MLFFDALKRCQPVLEPVLVPHFPRFINTLVQYATEAEVRPFQAMNTIDMSQFFAFM